MCKDFQKEQMKTEMKSDMINDAMDMEADQGEADDIYSQILGEIGMDIE